MARPEPIHSILPSVLGKLQGEAQGPMEKMWKQFLGRKGDKTKIESFRKGRLVVSVGNASLLHDLTLQKEGLLRKFDQNLGRGVVQDIQLRIGEIR